MIDDAIDGRCELTSRLKHGDSALRHGPTFRSISRSKAGSSFGEAQVSFDEFCSLPSSEVSLDDRTQEPCLRASSLWSQSANSPTVTSTCRDRALSGPSTNCSSSAATFRRAASRQVGIVSSIEKSTGKIGDKLPPKLPTCSDLECTPNTSFYYTISIGFGASLTFPFLNGKS